jgi:hypothetical protein
MRLFEGPSLHEIAADLDGISHGNESGSQSPDDTENDVSGFMHQDGLITLSPGSFGVIPLTTTYRAYYASTPWESVQVSFFLS